MLKFPLWPKQRVALETTATEVLYGGAAGGGKSYLMRVAAILWCMSIPGLQVYLFRRIRDDLVKTHVEGPKGFRVLLAPLVASGSCVVVEDEIRFWNGAKIYLCHCKDEKDRFKYLGAEIHVLIIDELTTFTEVIYRYLRGRVRAVGLKVPPELADQFPRILCGTNPGNIGHLWVKNTFIDGHVELECWRAPSIEGGMRRQYIPARLEDNPSMAKDDPGYEDRLLGLGSATLVKAMREGDWEIIEGAYFDCWSTRKHVIRPFEVPEHWTRFRSMDWGSFHPFAIYWWAAVSETYRYEDPDTGDTYIIPRDALVCYREWYGQKPNSAPNTGIKLTDKQLALGIKEREANDNCIDFAASPADPSMYIESGGPSHAEKMSDEGVFLDEADNSRIPGWAEMRARLVGEDGRPMIYFFNVCVHAIRTIPALMHDTHKPEDVNSKTEDHAGDAVRYMCMGRPWAAPTKAKKRDRRRSEWDDDDDERTGQNWKTR